MDSDQNRCTRALITVLGVISALLVPGCYDNLTLPTTGEFVEFQGIGPTGPAIDMGNLVRARLTTGPCRVVPDEVIEFTMPAILRVVTADGSDPSEETEPFICRVTNNGTVSLPVVGDVRVAGKTLGEIESVVAKAYYPDYMQTYPAIYAKVLEPKTYKVSISGAVDQPGIYQLRGDQMSIVALLMAAGGIVNEGAATISVERSQSSFSPLRMSMPESNIPRPRRSNSISLATFMEAEHPYGDSAGEIRRQIDMVAKFADRTERPSARSSQDNTFVLPVRGLNIPFVDAALQEGDSIVVERFEMPLFSVIGLVNRSANFEYPQEAHYNLMQAIAFAGGLNEAADPRYAVIYRLRPDGTIAHIAVDISRPRNGSDLMSAMNVQIKPGDIVALEHTPRTRTTLFLDKVFRINMGMYFRPDFDS
jgi:protein involved in polysaccharide export with SLBB domain